MAAQTSESSAGRSNMLSDMLVSVHPIVSVVNESFAEIRRIDLEAHGKSLCAIVLAAFDIGGVLFTRVCVYIFLCW